MANPIYKTVSFRKPTELQNTLPITLIRSANKEDAEETEKKLELAKNSNGERPSNDELLGYLAARMGKERSLTMNKLDALAFALLKTGDRAVGTRVLAEMRRREGNKLRLADPPRESVFGDILMTARKGRPEGIHSDSYLKLVQDAAVLWKKQQPKEEAELKGELGKLIGEASLVKKGKPSGDAEKEFALIEVPLAFLIEAPSNKECLAFQVVRVLIKKGIHPRKACVLVLNALEELLGRFENEASKTKLEIVGSSNSGRSKTSFLSFNPFKTLDTEVQAIEARTVLVHKDFASMAGFVSKSLQEDGTDELQQLGTTLIKEVNSFNVLVGRIRGEIRCLEALCSKLSDSEPDSGTVSRPAKPCVSSFGIGDLYVVEEEWLGNVAREISYIENARGGESRTRIHERETEEITYEETERTTEESKSESLQTADRFELQSTVEKQTNLEVGVNANLTVSGSYGTASFEASAGASFGFSRTEAASTTVTRAKETVSKATSEIRNLIREKLATTIRERTLSRDEHRFQAVVDNSSVFRFVEKKYKVQVKQFGARLFLEFLVPEPGRTLIERKAATHGLGPFNLQPDDINYDSYLRSIHSYWDETRHLDDLHFARLAAKYDARGIEPPPRKITVDVGLQLSTSETYASAEETVNVPEGYRVEDYRIRIACPAHGNMRVSANGHALFNYAGGAGETYPLYPHSCEISEPGIVVSANMITGVGYAPKFKGYANVALILAPNNDRVQQWRLETWQRLRDGYLNQLAEAEAKFEEASSGLSVEDPPARLRLKEKAELQRSIMVLMTGKSPNFSRVEKVLPEVPGDYGFYQPKGCNALEKAKISFFDGAFEWHDMIPFYMPYMFGETSKWSNRLNLKTIDEKHRQFLFAGEAKVMVPVTPGQEAKVLEFIDTPLVDQDAFFNTLENRDEVSHAGALPDLSTDILREILSERNDQYRIGAGQLQLNGNAFTVIPQVGLEQLTWVLDPKIDIGREVMIEGTQYIVEAVIDDTQGRFRDDTLRNDTVDYYLGAVPIGDPWMEYVPTPLVILGGQEYKLGTVEGAEAGCPPLSASEASNAALEAALSALEALVEDPAASDQSSQIATLRNAEEAHRNRLQEEVEESQESANELLEDSNQRITRLDNLSNSQEGNS